MSRLKLALLCIVIGLPSPVAAQERVLVGTQRLAENGALFLAAAQGYFKAEGIDLGMTAYESDQAVAETLAAGTTDFGLAGFTPAAFNAGGKGLIKAIAAQAREKRYYEGSELVASNFGFAKGLRTFADVANKSIAISALGSASHYQLEQIARIKQIAVDRISVKPMPTLDGIARAVGTNQVDAAILPARYARELLAANNAKLVGWYSEVDEQQLGALFVSSKMIATRRPVVEKFVRAYRRGVADYTATLLRKDIHSKRTSDMKSHGAATTIARYVYPDRGESGAAVVEASAYFIEPQAQLDLTDLERQSHGTRPAVGSNKNVTAREVVDLSFIK